MNWSDVLADPCLQDLPYKIELNGYGQIVMTPASNQHGRYQAEIVYLLTQRRTQGSVISECSVSTSDGVKVADVAWVSDAFTTAHGFTTPLSAAPELCVEVWSPSNTEAELTGKIRLYFEQGAEEVWLCDEEGEIEFFAPAGALVNSRLFPNFPAHID